MSDPVILIGLREKDGSLALVGLYPSVKSATNAIGGTTPAGLNYSIMTPSMGKFVQPKPYPNADPLGPED